MNGGSREVRNREPGAESDPRVLCALQGEDARKSRSEGSERCLEEVETSGGFELLTLLRSFPGVLTQHPPSGASLPCIH